MPPSTLALERLIKSEPMTESEWLEQIELRQEAIKPYFDSFTLPELGQLVCLSSGGSKSHRINADNPYARGDGRFSLKTQGIFQIPLGAEKIITTSSSFGNDSSKHCNLTKLAWGMIRLGGWILVEIEVSRTINSEEEVFEKAMSVRLTESDPSTLMKETGEKPWEILIAISKIVEGWKERLERQRAQVESLDQLFRSVDFAISKREVKWESEV